MIFWNKIFKYRLIAEGFCRFYEIYFLFHWNTSFKEQLFLQLIKVALFYYFGVPRDMGLKPAWATQTIRLTINWNIKWLLDHHEDTWRMTKRVWSWFQGLWLKSWTHLSKLSDIKMINLKPHSSHLRKNDNCISFFSIFYC